MNSYSDAHLNLAAAADSNEKRRLKLISAISIISFLSVWVFVTIYIILDVNQLAFRIKLLGLMSIGTLIPLALNRFKLYLLAKIIVSSYNTILMLLFVILFRADTTNGHVFFLIYGLIPIFVWSARDWPYIAFFYAINVLCFIFIEFVDFEYSHAISDSIANSDFLNGLTILLSFAAATFAIIIFHRIAYQKETILQKLNEQNILQKEQLLLTNKSLQDKIKELTIKEGNLNQANSVKSKMFSIIAHDLRGPFSSLKSLLELITTEYDSLEENNRRTYLESACNTSQSTYALLDNLLDWSRLQTNRIKVDKKPVNLVEICENAINLNASRMNKKELKVVNYIPEHFYVKADKYMLSTVFRNLISNATKYTPLRGQITIKAEINHTRTEISIKDTGVGMSSYDIDQLFNFEKNFTKPGTENEKGTGLGLLICKEFIELMGSELLIESEEGVGSSFKFTLENTNIV